jgi:hypothetical protein
MVLGRFYASRIIVPAYSSSTILCAIKSQRWKIVWFPTNARLTDFTMINCATMMIVHVVVLLFDAWFVSINVLLVVAKACCVVGILNHSDGSITILASDHKEETIDWRVMELRILESISIDSIQAYWSLLQYDGSMVAFGKNHRFRTNINHNIIPHVWDGFLLYGSFKNCVETITMYEESRVYIQWPLIYISLLRHNIDFVWQIKRFSNAREFRVHVSGTRDR